MYSEEIKKVSEKLIKYVKINTQSDEESNSFPSTERQKDLARLLFSELKDLGLEDVSFDEQYGYVYAKVPANDGGKNPKVLGFIAHMDTSPETSGENVNPQYIYNYDGKDINLSDDNDYILSPSVYPELLDYIGKTLITTDGNTLLGADDKAGVAEIMTMVSILANHPEIKHGELAIGFTPDEEVGAGVDYFDVKRFGADYAYTVDGGGIGELEYENFNAASAKVLIKGVTVHPGEAKDKMKNASLIAMEFNALLPQKERPEYTSGYEGFYYLTDICGETESCTLSYIIRDHDMRKFREKIAVMEEAAKEINGKYGENTVELTIKDQYFNMKEKIEDGNMFLIDNAVNAMKEIGIEPKVQPIRGGTDGARLSFMGLPCPNLFTGGHNYHGRFEYVCVESMEKAVELILKLAVNV